jgi:hypothetical protein
MITCSPQMTLYSSAFASPSRLKLTDRQCTIQWTNAAMQRYQYAPGRHADVATLSAVHSLGMRLDIWTLRGAAAVAAVFKLQWLCTHQHFVPSTDLSYAAAGSSSLAVLAWLSQQGVVMTTQTAAHAATSDQVAALQYLRAEGCPWGVEVCSAAAASGSFAALRWAHAQGCPWDDGKILSAAASSGSIELTAWVRQQPGVPVHPGVLAAAARHGRTALCAYLLQQHYPADESACLCAVRSGHVDTLRYLRDRACVWNEDQMRIRGAAVGSVELLQYLQQQGFW